MMIRSASRRLIPLLCSSTFLAAKNKRSLPSAWFAKEQPFLDEGRSKVLCVLRLWSESAKTLSSLLNNVPERTSRSQVLAALHLGQEHLVPKLLSRVQNVSVDDCNAILLGCFRAKNAKIAKQVQSFMASNGIDMNKESYTYYLSALSCGGHFDEAFNLLDSLIKGHSRVQPTISMYNGILYGCSHFGLNSIATKCLDCMDKQGLIKNSETYVELIKLAGKLGNVNMVHDLWNELVKVGRPCFRSYRHYIIALCRTLNLDEAISAFEKMLDLYSKNILSTQTECPENDMDDLHSEDICKVFNAIMNAAGKAGHHHLAESLFSEMRRMGLKTDVYTYNALLRAVVKGRGVEKGLQIVKAMKEDGVEIDSLTYSALVEGYCVTSELDKAEDLVQDMLNGKPNQRPSSHTFNFIIDACASMDDPERALKIFGKMRAAQVSPDMCTYTALFSALGNVSAPYSGGDKWSHDELMHRIVAIETDMARNGLQHTRQSFTALMNTLGAEGMMGALLKRLHDIEGSAIAEGSSLVDAVTYNTAIYACVMYKQVEQAADIFERMRAKGVKPTLQTYNIMILGCVHSKSTKNAFELVDAMREDGITPDLYTYNSLIKVLCSCGELDVGVGIIDSMIASDVEPDVITFNTLISAASYERLDLIEFLVEDMYRQGIQPDNLTCLQVVYAYVHAQQADDAAIALHVLSSRMLVTDNVNNTEVSGANVDDQLKVLAQDRETEMEDLSSILLKDASDSQEPVAMAMYNLNLANIAAGSNDSLIGQHVWTARLCSLYDKRKTRTLAL
ncbi:hypothetical protein O6H91_06G013400 [Diphasiastrum complanatum]|uniref:Uncharacterized protein n=1 Tax=Diphasiastrum complanatum TaxID=34168 RepID=A0ACC2DAP1_DIPCM|nr:hypothetical protein O6H91_06G013400 [Diphasiastrum complanatum]